MNALSIPDGAAAAGRGAGTGRRQAGWLAALLLATAACLGLGSSGVRAQTSEPWPELPRPPDAEVKWVGQSMRVNGVPTRIQVFDSRASRTQVVEFFRSHWSGAYARPPSVKPMGDTTTVVGQKHGPYLLTAKVEDAPHGGSKGLISVALVVGTKDDRAPGELPMPPGAHVISVVESDDPGKHSREWTVAAPQSTAAATQFYDAALANAGWHRMQETTSARRAGVAAASLLGYSREGREFLLSITDQPKGRGCVVVANLVTKGTGPGSD